MKHGNITCACGQAFYFETEMESIRCLNCGAKFDTDVFADIIDVVAEPVVDTELQDVWGVDPAALV